MYVCICNAVTDSDIRGAVEEGVGNLWQLKQTTGCGTTCGSCEDMADEILQQALTEARQTRHILSDLQLA
ncbi:MAG: (2Fe-2S)-binding protein [Lysobacterales bacterium]